MVGLLVRRPEGGIDVAMFEALHDRLSLDRALDLREIDDWSQSWAAASARNRDRLDKLVRDSEGRS